MGRPKVRENERCEGVYVSGVHCRHRATVGDPPRFCRACDPSPEGRARVAALASKRHPPGTSEAKARDEARAEGTLDEIVRRSLALAGTLEGAAKKATGSPDGLRMAASLGFAASRLHAQAIAALKARSTVGDVLPRAKDEPKPETSPAVAQAQDGCSLAALDAALDS